MYMHMHMYMYMYVCVCLSVCLCVSISESLHEKEETVACMRFFIPCVSSFHAL